MCFHVLSIVYGHSGILIHGSILFFPWIHLSQGLDSWNGLNGYNGWLTNTQPPKDPKSSPKKNTLCSWELFGKYWPTILNLIGWGIDKAKSKKPKVDWLQTSHHFKMQNDRPSLSVIYSI